MLFITTRSVFSMRIIKSVSIPLELAKKIEAIPNFSAYIASMIANDDMHLQTVLLEAYKRQVKHLHKTLREIAQSDQRVTRKQYIRNIVNMIDERHPHIWSDEDEN